MIKQLSKRFSAVICVVMILTISVMPVFAQNSYSINYAVTDDSNIFTSEQFADLCTSAEAAGKQAGFQVAVHTDDKNIDSSEMDTYYNKYHDSDSKYQPDGVMLVFDTKSNNRVILTYGKAEKYFDDARMDALKSTLKPALSSGDNYQAAKLYVAKVQEYVTAGVSGNGTYNNVVQTPTEKSNEPKILQSLKKFGWIGGIAGVIIAIIFVAVNVGRYKYNGKSGTYDLGKNSQMTLLDSQDVFVSKHTTYTTIQSSSNNSSSGGSSSHGSSGSF